MRRLFSPDRFRIVLTWPISLMMNVMTKILEIPPSLTKVELAREAGISRVTLDRWIKGRRVQESTRRVIREALDRLKEQQAA